MSHHLPKQGGGPWRVSNRVLNYSGRAVWIYDTRYPLNDFAL